MLLDANLNSLAHLLVGCQGRSHRMWSQAHELESRLVVTDPKIRSHIPQTNVVLNAIDITHDPIRQVLLAIRDASGRWSAEAQQGWIDISRDRLPKMRRRNPVYLLQTWAPRPLRSVVSAHDAGIESMESLHKGNAAIDTINIVVLVAAHCQLTACIG
jgi:hypothetical protein